MTLWQYSSDEYTPETANWQPTAETIAAQSCFDAVSESWCSVQYPAENLQQAKASSSLPSIPPQQRVADWIQQSCLSRTSVYYEPSGTVAVQFQRRRSLGEASLQDFLGCSGPYRPSFMDHRVSNKYALLERQSTQSGSSSARVNAKKSTQHGGKTTKGRSSTSRPSPAASATSSMHVGVISTGTSSRCSASAERRQQNVGRCRPGREVAAVPTNTASIAAAEGDADFLSHAFHRFVSFQPMDFVSNWEELISGTAECDAKGGDIGEFNDDSIADGRTALASSKSSQSTSQALWTYLTDLVDDLTRDVTYIH
ncbi:hypothetical protein GGI07_003149 [Coemansia sp. Benny D115]|nr:hypothetical protein GGI07_003149 [Coemansia sp. Benny D115]